MPMSSERDPRKKSAIIRKTITSTQIRTKNRIQFLLAKSRKLNNVIVAIQFGKYTAAGITKKEALVDGQCLRVHVDRLNKTKKKESVNKSTRNNNPLKSKSGRTLFRLPVRFRNQIETLSLLPKPRRRRPNRKFKKIRRPKVSKDIIDLTGMSTDSENAEKSTESVTLPDNSDKPDESFDEVKSFLPLEESLTAIPEPISKEPDPLGFDSDPLSTDNELSSTVQNEDTEKFNGQTTPLRTYAGKRPPPATSPSVSSEVEEKRQKLDDTDSEDLEALLSGNAKAGEEGEDKEDAEEGNEETETSVVVPKAEEVNGDSVKTDEEEEEKRIETPRSTYNGNSAVVDNGCVYTLICRTGRPGRKRILKNNLGFEKLVHQLKLIRLPAPNWKIRIFVTRDQQISEITFTNKEAKERCVKFSRSTITYVITFDSKVVTLIGAPTSIDSHIDITHLLEIVNGLDEDDPILEYGLVTK